MKAKDRRLDEIKALIPEVMPTEALALQSAGALLIDVREADEIAAGSPQQALRLGRGFLELRIEDTVPDKSRTLLTMCAGGMRSLFAAYARCRSGCTEVRSEARDGNRWWRSV